MRRPTVWWDRHCQRTYLTKLRLWNTNDSGAFGHAVRVAKLTQTRALRKYKQQLRERLRQGSNDRVWWQTIKSISGICASSARSAPDVEDLGEFFASKFTLRDGFEESKLDSVESVVSPKRSWRIKLSKVRHVLCGLDVTKAVGPDGVSPRLLKNCCLELCHPLFLLFRRVSSEAIIPASWKIARITPVYKRRGSVTHPSFYRPISVLPTLALLFERVISSQLYNYITPFIPQSQYGFLKGTGAQDCGTVIALFATQALELRQECRVVSLDIKGAFDRIWWNGLLQHLSCIGVCGKAFALFRSYLSNRYLYVVANAKESSQYPIQAGVPQGAVWSPMLFNLYVRQLPLQVHHSLLVSYADDSTLLKIVPSREARKLAAEEINSDLNAIVCWGKRWHIEFEPAKSSALCISFKRDLEDHPSLVMDGIGRDIICVGVPF